MFGTLKRKGLIWSVTISLSTLFVSCNESTESEPIPVKEDKSLPITTIQGNTQGTTYTIIIVEDEPSVKKGEFDQILAFFDEALSTYIPTSDISKINAGRDSVSVSDRYSLLWQCYQESYEVYKSTNGLFDPSVYPLVEGWGFMNDMETPLTQNKIDSLLKFVSFEQGNLYSIDKSDEGVTINKKNANFKMDFNAIAQGQSVDVLCEHLNDRGIENYYVEIGGELRVKGKNKRGTSWNIGIDSPQENLKTRVRDTIVHISNKAIATSGNYRKFYVKDGIKYSHTLNPKTGKPVTHTLLSATVIADKCSTADAYATAFMVMGVEQALSFVEHKPELGLEIYLLYADENGDIQHKMSKGFSNYLQ